MKRDMDLIRAVLRASESGNHGAPIDGYTSDAVKYHRALAIEAKLLDGSVKYSSTGESREIPAFVLVHRLTWDGHEFLAAVGPEAEWRRIKAFVANAGKELTIQTVLWGARAALAGAGSGA